MIQRMAVEADLWGTDDFFARDLLDGTLTRWPHGASAYFFGHRMYEELWRQKGPEGIKQLVTNYSSGWPYFLDGPLKEAYGFNYPTLWKTVFEKTRESSRKEIAEIKKTQLSKWERLTATRENKSDLTLSPDRTRLAFRSWDPEEGSRLNIFDISKNRVIESHEINSTTAQGLCWVKRDNAEGILFLEADAVNASVLNSTKWLELGSGDKKNINLGDKPLRHLHRMGCDPKGETVLVYQEAAGKGRVLELELKKEPGSPSFTEKRSWSLPEGSWVTSFLPGAPHWIGLRTGLQTAFFRWDDKTNPQFVKEARGLYHQFRRDPASAKSGDLWAVADIDGREEVWAIELSKGIGTKRLALLGGTNSFDTDGGRVFFLNYQHGGYDLAKADALKLSSISLPAPKAAEPVSGAATVSAPENYRALETLIPRTWIPQMLFVPSGLQVGIWVPGFDIAQRHYYNIVGGYDTRGLPFAEFDYTHRFGSNYFANGVVYYSPSYIQSTRDFFKRWGATLSFGGTIDPIPPAITLSTIFRRIEPTSFTTEQQSVGLQLGLSYRFGLKKRPLSVAPYQGTILGASYAYFFKELGSTDNYFSTSASAEQYLAAPWWREHIWYLAVKGAFTENSPLFNNYFEAGGELLFTQGRGVYLNRGFLPGLFLARRIFNVNLEYKFPIARIDRGWGYTPLFLKTIHGALVSDLTTFDRGPLSPAPQDIFRVYYASAGVELKTDWTLGFYLPGQLRVGAYHGFGPYGEDFYFTVGAEASL